MPEKLNIAGCGHLGRTLARLWSNERQFTIGHIFNRSIESTQEAINFIGSGTVCSNVEAFNNAKFWLIATPDSSIKQTALALSRLPLDWKNTTVFHASGAHSSKLLAPLSDAGAMTASCHPVHSFANPDASLTSFAGSFVTAEGEPQALHTLKPKFAAINSQWLQIEAQAKLVYHAASVFACNYLVTLLNADDTCLAHSLGEENPQGLSLLQPLIKQTLTNILNVGAESSLSGPVKRGDTALIKDQLHALGQINPELALLYQHLGKQTLELANLPSNDQTRKLYQLLSKATF